MKPIVETTFITDIIGLINNARERVKTSINTTMVYTYYEIGRKIVEQEQKGKNRAEYGKELLNKLSYELTKEFGVGYSLTNLKLIRKFYLLYRDQKSQPMADHFKNLSNSGNAPVSSYSRQFCLSWTMYTILIVIKNSAERSFYEIECYNSNWSKRELQRQINSCLYERLMLSRDKKGVMDLSKRGQVIERPIDVLKDPFVLEFLDLDEKERYSENDLETEILNKIQYFLLELGKGFTFVKRQMRLTINNKYYHADLVFYNRFLRCFVIIDLKIGEATHQDIGQMQMYVNYYDRYVKSEDENKTIGILLCKDKDDAVVRLTLPENNDQIFASKYETLLPSKNELLKLLEEK